MPAGTFTKETLIAELKRIRNCGWVENPRNTANPGNIGNLLENLLGIEENNLPIPNASEWELKTQKINTNSLLTLFHMEPSPRALHIVPYLVENFGWPHKKAGKGLRKEEKSFRQTLLWHKRTNRGFELEVDDSNNRIGVNFDFDAISPEHEEWKKLLISLGNKTLKEEFTPYWGFNDVFHKAGTKLTNCFFVLAEEKRENKKNFVRYGKFIMLSNFQITNLISAIKNQDVYVDFDARTGHNHGTKFRIKPDAFSTLYKNVEVF